MTTVYLGWLVLSGIVTFALYGMDKAKAKSGAWRIPESTLHLLALAGGVAGGWLGRAVFRHKTQKTIFLVVLLAATALHGAVLWWLVAR